VLRRAIYWTVKRRGRPAPNASDPACKIEVGNYLHIWDLDSPVDIAGRIICSHCLSFNVVHVRGYSRVFQMVDRSANQASMCLRLLALIYAAHFCDAYSICSNWAVFSPGGAVLTPSVFQDSFTSKRSSSTLSPV
jgi:hypothetical protein